MSYYSGPSRISGAIRILEADYPEEGQPVVAEATAPPTYSNENLRVSKPLSLVDEFNLQPPELIPTLKKSNAIVNENDAISGLNGGGSLSRFRPLQNTSGNGPVISNGDHQRPGSLGEFGRREQSSSGSSSTANRKANPANAGNSMTGNDFMDAFNKFHQLGVGKKI